MRLGWLSLLVAMTACSGPAERTADAGSGGNPGNTAGQGGKPSNTAGGPAVPTSLAAELTAVKGSSASTLAERYPTSFVTELGYEPRDAAWLDRVQNSSLALNENELAALSARGFAISDRLKQPNFFYGYKSLYFEHLPLFVSADSILYAVHRSYDSLLANVESASLQPALTRAVKALRTKLQGSPASQAKTDLALYLDVADALLSNAGSPGGPVLTDAKVKPIVDDVLAANGSGTVTLFGSARDEDFSQFAPRGHYVGYLAPYFRAMMWFGRIDFRLVETTELHERVLRRPAVEAMLLLRELVDADIERDLSAIENTVSAFVGEVDYMTLAQVASLESDLGISDAAGLAALSDAQIAAAIEAGGYGEQRIASHLMVNGLDNPQRNNSSFALLGQRYVLDSHVFSNVTYSRVSGNGKPKRMMPDPLDVAFAALGNNQALSLLTPQLDQYGYAGALGSMRVLADAHPADYWQSSLYTVWLDTLRQFSSESQTGLPSVARTEAWGRRLLNTELASWAELRHDTLLYAKQSYTGIPSCEYPDAYVDPYPQVFEGIRRFAQRGSEITAQLATLSTQPSAAGAYFERLASIATTLRDMATAQRSGTPHSAEALAFINQAVRIEKVDAVCTFVDEARGWYSDLFFNRDDVMEFDPTIADVHTQPADEGGSIVGKVLHVGTGNVRPLVVTVDSCQGPRAYVGFVSSYFEQVTSNFERLNDQNWANTVRPSSPADVPWMSTLVER